MYVFTQVWQLSTSGRIIQFENSLPLESTTVTGVKFLDPNGASFAVAAYDSEESQIFIRTRDDVKSSSH